MYTCCIYYALNVNVYDVACYAWRDEHVLHEAPYIYVCVIYIFIYKNLWQFPVCFFTLNCPLSSPSFVACLSVWDFVCVMYRMMPGLCAGVGLCCVWDVACVLCLI